MITLTLSPDEASLLISALDSHQYWELSDDNHRWNGFALEPDDDEDENAGEYYEAQVLIDKIRAAREESCPPETSSTSSDPS